MAAASIFATSVMERSRLWQFQCIDKGARHVAHMDEVAPLLAILEDHRLLAVEETSGENRKYAGIGIGQRLARPIDVEKA
jgi:hypothetical protein